MQVNQLYIHIFILMKGVFELSNENQYLDYTNSRKTKFSFDNMHIDFHLFRKWHEKF